MTSWAKEQIHNSKETSGRTGSKLLLLADHHDATLISSCLQTEGYIVHHSSCRLFEVELLERLQPDVVLIDLETPSVEQISICQTLRKRFRGPILILSAKASEIVQVLGLEMGADDFLFKPQSEAILLAKLRSQLRRSNETRQRQKAMVQLGELVIDASRREVWRAGESIHLTDREFDLLWCLAKNARNIISRDEIHQSLYNREYNGFDRSIDIYISRIRQKIGDNPQNPRYLKTIRGAGYLLVESSCA